MPFTYNGIGTHYYGKRNLQSRPGACPHCHRSVNLLSYDTRLWFVVLFVPLIPLGRKRIIDSCPYCRRHYVAELQKWETARQLETSGALAKFRSDPSPENAIEAHRQLVAFHQHDEAAALQKTICEKFPDNARVQVYLGATLTNLGKAREGEPFFERAFQLRPDLPEARIGIARTHIRAKRLDEARALLDFMEKPGAAQLYSLAPLEQLAIAYQAAGCHLQALELFRHLLAELPALSENKAFRKMVLRSETGGTSILPKTKFSLRRFFQRPPPGTAPGKVANRTALIIVGCTLLLIVVALMISNIYIRLHRKLYIANALPQDLRLEIAGRAIPVPRGLTLVTLAEGHYIARLGGAVQDELPVDIHANYFQRWFQKPVWLLNPGGRALVVFERVPYTSNPSASTSGSYSYIFGDSFRAFPNVTHPFVPLPKTIKLDSAGTEKILTSLQLFRAQPVNAFYGLTKVHRGREALDLAEWRLRVDPTDTEMLQAYVGSATTTSEIPRIVGFLHSGLTNASIPVEWHRSYQDARSAQGDDAALVLAEYTDLIKADPTNSDLLYLCGRLVGDKAQGQDFFHRSLQANPANPYPMYALAYDYLIVGDWSHAKPLLDRVVELIPADHDFRDMWKLACLGTGQAGQAESEFRRLLKQDPTDWRSTFGLCDVLAAEGKSADSVAAITELLRAIQAASPGSETEMRSVMYLYHYYAFGDFSMLEQTARRDPSPAGKAALFHSLVEQNKLDEATKLFPLQEVTNPEILIAVSLAYRLNHQAAEAAAWHAAFVRALRQQGGRNIALAALLDADKLPSVTELEQLRLSLPGRAALLMDLALTHPELRDQLTQTARLINLDRTFPYFLVQRALGDKP